MISRNLYLNIVIRVLLVVLFSVLLGYLLVKDVSFRYSMICIIAVVAVTVSLISYLNSTNRKIRFFFDSVRNDDSSLSFPSDSTTKTFRELSRSMNVVNSQIQQLKIENRNQEQYFQILIEHLATGIISYDGKGYVINANSAAKKLLSIDVLSHIQQIERIDDKLYQAVKNIKPSERKLVSFHVDRDEIQLSLKATSFRLKDKDMVILSVQDIKSELDEKELESWMKLIRVLMHEIMNSIAPITSLSESLSRIYSADGKPLLPEQVTSRIISTTLQGLNVIKDQGRGLMSFVESFRKLTRVPEPVKNNFRVADLVSRIQILYSSLKNSQKVKLSVNIREPEQEIHADQNLVSQVLLNLVKNALEANEKNPAGEIIINAGIDANGRPEICVADNGPGIPEENLDEIFVPFFTTRQAGSGIGLSISRQIMRVHGGNLRVRSVPGQETVFCMTF
jgi:two-component system nitrogen regulation sensor histidine kinase NtrY